HSFVSLLTASCGRDYACTADKTVCSSAAVLQQKRTNAARIAVSTLGRSAMKTMAFAGTLMISLLGTTALTAAQAADMTFQPALNAGKEPQNWLLPHGNFAGHRFSRLKDINTDSVKNLKPVFSVALGGFESGGRYKFGNLEGTPIVEDGMMYVTD